MEPQARTALGLAGAVTPISFSTFVTEESLLHPCCSQVTDFISNLRVGSNGIPLEIGPGEDHASGSTLLGLTRSPPIGWRNVDSRRSRVCPERRRFRGRYRRFQKVRHEIK